MLTCTEEIYKDRFSFRIFGYKGYKTNVYKYFDKETDEFFDKKLLSILRAINSDPMNFCHDYKFKPLEEKVWEIKIMQHRIACIWDAKPYNLIAIYAFKKKTPKWPKQELEQMRRELAKYLQKRTKCIGGEYYGRNNQIQEKLD